MSCRRCRLLGRECPGCEKSRLSMEAFTRASAAMERLKAAGAADRIGRAIFAAARLP